MLWIAALGQFMMFFVIYSATAIVALKKMKFPLSFINAISMFCTHFVFQKRYYSCFAYAPELNRDALAGIWRLSGLKSIQPESLRSIEQQERRMNDQNVFTIKEFTTYPKKVKRQMPMEITAESCYMDSSDMASTSIVHTWYGQKDILLKLCDDGSFETYSSLDESFEEEEAANEDDSSRVDETVEARLDDTVDLVNVAELSRGTNYSKYTDYRPPSTSKIEEDSSTITSTFVTGLWDFKDGKLILAANRPLHSDPKKIHDTVLVGKVVAKQAMEPTFQNNQNLSDISKCEGITNHTLFTDRDHASSVDLHYLSIPNGKVNIGKFFYPMHHPSFFESPIFSPTKTGSFQLNQILGEASLRVPEYEQKSKDYTEESGKEFKKEQLAGKVFFLTSRPIGWEKKNKPRWSRSKRSFVVDDVSRNENEKFFGLSVMEVVLFANSTFSTISGLGSSTVLRGKWDIVGTDRNYLWMQVWRFGFGRSVSGSTYSEGPGLSKSDEKAYWGKIEECTVDNSGSGLELEELENKKRIEIKGTIFWGWGLEPVPEGQFSMLEKLVFDDESSEEDDDEGDDTDFTISGNNFE